MSLQTSAATQARDAQQTAAANGSPFLTLFTIPKPFRSRQETGGDQTALIQSNAIGSWQQLAPAVEIVLCGDDEGVAEFAGRHGLRHLAGLRTSPSGTPLVGDAFRRVAQESSHGLLAWCNADVILLPDFVGAAERLMSESGLTSLLAFGRRTDLAVDQPLDLSTPGAARQLLHESQQRGRRAPRVCKEYFLFTRDVIESMPDFVVGRGNWDNWMVASARSRGIPVIDLSPCVHAIHQMHGYGHTGKSRLECYVTGAEARENQRLAGGQHIIRGSCGTWTLDRDGLKPKRLSWLNTGFWTDLPAFWRLVGGLPFQH
jgi:hypothetical protein